MIIGRRNCFSVFAGFPRRPISQSIRFVIGFWLLFSFVIIGTYTGNLVAFLTVEKFSVPFRTFEELAKDTSYKVGTLGGALNVALLQVVFLPHTNYVSYIFSLF